jgi:hypothetical protein
MAWKKTMIGYIFEKKYSIVGFMLGWAAIGLIWMWLYPDDVYSMMLVTLSLVLIFLVMAWFSESRGPERNMLMVLSLMSMGLWGLGHALDPKNLSLKVGWWFWLILGGIMFGFFLWNRSLIALDKQALLPNEPPSDGR